MPYKVIRVVDVETEGGRTRDNFGTDNHFEIGLNRLEEFGWRLQSVIPAELHDPVRLVFFKDFTPEQRRQQIADYGKK